MSNPDDGTADFQVGGLRDLLESEESPPSRGGGGPKNPQLLIGGGIAVVVVILAAVLLLGGGGDDDSPDTEGLAPAAVSLLPEQTNSSMKKDGTFTVCSTKDGKIADEVVIRSRTTEEKPPFGDVEKFEVLVKPDDVGKLGVLLPATARFVPVGSACPPVATTTTVPAEAPAEEAPAEPPATEPPATTPPASG